MSTDPSPPVPAPHDPTARRAAAAYGAVPPEPVEPAHGRHGGGRGPAWLLGAVVVVLGLAALVGVALTWPDGETTAGAGLVDVDVQYLRADVTDARWTTCDGTIEDVAPDGTVPETVQCLQVDATVTGGSLAGTQVQVLATSGVGVDDVPPGTGIIVERYPPIDGAAEVWAWGDYQRGLPLGTFALVFALVTVLVAGLRGLRALIGLALAFVVLAVYLIPGLVQGQSGLVVALSASTVIVIIVLYLAHGVSLRTTTALVGTLAGLAMVTGLGVLGAELAHLQPGSTEETYRLARLLGDDGIQILRGVFLSGVVLAGIGVLNDVTITQAAAVFELRASDPDASWRRLFERGMRIGRDHIASTVYTIAFAYAGASLPVLLLLELYAQPLARTLTTGEFAEEIVRTLAGSVGLVLAIPLTTLIAALAAVTVHDPARLAGTGHSHTHRHVG